MSTYKGLKSSDAEIVLDLEKGKVFFDYSLNKTGNQYSSNESCILSKHTNRKTTLNDVKLVLYYWFVSPMIYPWWGMIACYYPKYQYGWQKALKSFSSFVKGEQVQTCIGRIYETRYVFHIDTNVWFNYELDGDYKEKIKKISLLRHFIIRERNGVTSHIQRGWDVVFEFKDIPKDGYCVLRSCL